MGLLSVSLNAAAEGIFRKALALKAQLRDAQ